MHVYIYVYIYIYIYVHRKRERYYNMLYSTPNLPTNIIPTKIACLRLSGRFPVGLGLQPLKMKFVLESKTLKSIMLVGRLGVV